MALITCPECGKEISSTVSKCPHCGYEIKKGSSKVTILGYAESFAINPSISILQSDLKIGEVSQNGKVEIDIEKGSLLKFQRGFHSTTCLVKPGDWILLSFNRLTRCLGTIVTDKDNYQSAINKARRKDNVRLVWMIVVGIILLALGFFL